ncbi:MAG: response regulator [Desulfamplus sp.]|nr:response regulator [Desulfamplus sp.]
MTKTILMVDDSQFTLDIFSFAIQAAGYNILTAQNGLEALEILQKNKVDLLVVDVNMPVMDGYTLTRKVREMPDLAEKPVIIMTTLKESKDKEKGYAAGADLYMIKPVHPDEMVDQIKLFVGE